MVSDLLIRIWKKNGMSEEWINKKLEEEGNNKVLIKKSSGEKQTRNRTKEFPETISFRIDDFLAERLNRYIYQQLNYSTKSKGAIYRHIFEKFLKSAYKEFGFDWGKRSNVKK